MALHGEIACEIHSSTIAFKWMFKLHAIAVAHTTHVSTTARPYEPYVSIPLPALILPPFEMNEFVRWGGGGRRRGYPYMTANGLSNEANINSISFRRTAITQFWFIYLFVDHFWYDTREPSSVLGAWLISNFETKLARTVRSRLMMMRWSRKRIETNLISLGLDLKIE